MTRLSVVMITRNEEKHIADAVNSASFADEVLVLDCGSTDKTCNIARRLGARIAHHGWLGHGAQKNKAIKLADSDWNERNVKSNMPMEWAVSEAPGNVSSA